MLTLKKVSDKTKLEQELQKGLDVKAKKEEYDQLIKETLQSRRDLLSGGNFRSDEKIHQMTKDMEDIKELVEAMQGPQQQK